MKRLVTLITSLFFFLNTFSQAPAWQWARSAGGPYFEYGNDITTDPWGNVLVTGYFHSLNFVLENTTLINTNPAGGIDFFVAKYDPAGNLIWATNGGGLGHDRAYSIATDANGNVLVTGTFEGSSLILGNDTLIHWSGLNKD